MQFNPTEKSISLYADCLGTLGISESDTTTYPIVTFTRNANKWLGTANQWIWDASGEWEYDDSNYTDFAIAVGTLVAGQNDYSLPSTCQKVDGISVKDSDGDWVKLTPKSKEEFDADPAEYNSTNGLPQYYDLVGNSYFLYPAPSATECTLASGLKVFFSRDLDKFTITDTTQEPGFVSDFHEIISKGAAIEWATAHMPERVASLYQVISRIKSDMQNFYGSRSRETKTKFTPKVRNVK
jgi:hypothetical protein